MKKVLIIKNGKVIIQNAEIADSFFSRFKGLMFKKSIAEDYALHIKPCNQIHTFNMRFSIDVIYLSETGKVIRIDENVKSNRVCKTVKGAKSVIETNCLSASKFGIIEGDILEICNIQ